MILLAVVVICLSLLRTSQGEVLTKLLLLCRGLYKISNIFGKIFAFIPKEYGGPNTYHKKDSTFHGTVSNKFYENITIHTPPPGHTYIVCDLYRRYKGRDQITISFMALSSQLKLSTELQEIRDLQRN
jgi:hypothetical protein